MPGASRLRHHFLDLLIQNTTIFRGDNAVLAKKWQQGRRDDSGPRPRTAFIKDLAVVKYRRAVLISVESLNQSSLIEVVPGPVRPGISNRESPLAGLASRT